MLEFHNLKPDPSGRSSTADHKTEYTEPLDSLAIAVSSTTSYPLSNPKLVRYRWFEEGGITPSAECSAKPSLTIESSPRSEQAAWVRCIWLKTRGSTARSRSKSCRPVLPKTP